MPSGVNLRNRTTELSASSGCAVPCAPSTPRTPAPRAQHGSIPLHMGGENIVQQSYVPMCGRWSGTSSSGVVTLDDRLDIRGSARPEGCCCFWLCRTRDVSDTDTLSQCLRRMLRTRPEAGGTRAVPVSVYHRTKRTPRSTEGHSAVSFWGGLDLS